VYTSHRGCRWSSQEGGQKYNERFRSAEGVEKVRLDDEEIYNYLYTWVARRVFVWPTVLVCLCVSSWLSAWIWRIADLGE
jgi:hypothetical protein